MYEEKKSPACPKYEAVLEDYASEQLSGAEKESVAAHLQSCTGCAAAVESAVHARALLRFAAEPTEDPGPFFARRVMQRIQAVEESARTERGFWKPLEVLAMRTVWASAAAIALVVAYANISGMPQKAVQTEVRATTDQGGLFVDPTAPMSRDDAFLNITDTRNGQQ